MGFTVEQHQKAFDVAYRGFAKIPLRDVTPSVVARILMTINMNISVISRRLNRGKSASYRIAGPSAELFKDTPWMRVERCFVPQGTYNEDRTGQVFIWDTEVLYCKESGETVNSVALERLIERLESFSTSYDLKTAGTEIRVECVEKNFFDMQTVIEHQYPLDELVKGLPTAEGRLLGWGTDRLHQSMVKASLAAWLYRVEPERRSIVLGNVWKGHSPAMEIRFDSATAGRYPTGQTQLSINGIGTYLPNEGKGLLDASDRGVQMGFDIDGIVKWYSPENGYFRVYAKVGLQGVYNVQSEFNVQADPIWSK